MLEPVKMLRWKILPAPHEQLMMQSLPGILWGFSYLGAWTPELRNQQKLAKRRVAELRFTQFFFSRYDTYWMVVTCARTHPGGSKYVWLRGVGRLWSQVTAGRSWSSLQEFSWPNVNFKRKDTLPIFVRSFWNWISMGSCDSDKRVVNKITWNRF